MIQECIFQFVLENGTYLKVKTIQSDSHNMQCLL